MEIVKNHYIPAEKVANYNDIKSIVDEMREFINAGINKGNYTTGFAIAHNQVESEKPLAFFVLSDKAVKLLDYPHNAIINPEIIEATKHIDLSEDKNKKDVRENITEYEEGCFSFPFRTPKKVKRYFRIKVRYQVKTLTGLKTIEEWIEGLKAHIFQHEEQHCRGKNIYFEG